MQNYRDDIEVAQGILQKQTCPIFTDIDRLELLGTGTLVEIQNKYFIATAAHVIKKSNWGQIQIGCELLMGGLFTKLGRRFIGGEDEEKEDLAWIQVAPPGSITLDKIAKENEFWTAPGTETDDYFISGYPASLVTPQIIGQLKRTNLTHYVHLTGLLPKNQWKGSYVADYHMVLEHLERMYLPNGEVVKTPVPKGVSGGGIWYVDRQARRLRLAGIQIGTESEEEVHGIPIHEWLRFLKESTSGIC
jgi:hypothetical protein